MAIEKDEFTVNEAAERFGRTTARIRQICIKHGIGRCMGGRIRILKSRDLDRIGRIIERFGYAKNS